MVIYINSKKRLQIKSINFNIITYPLRQHEKLTFKKVLLEFLVALNVFDKRKRKCKNV